MALNKFQELVRARLREKTPNYSDLARFLNENPSTIQKRLREGGPALCLDFLDAVVTFYQMTVSEMCAAPGTLWEEVKPLESQLLRHFRAMNEVQRIGLLNVLESRQLVPTRDRTARMGRAELTEEQQLVVELYARSNEQAKSGILATLRGTAKAGDAERAQHHRTTE